MSLSHLGKQCPWNRQKFKVLDGLDYYECSKCHQFLVKDAFYKDNESFAGINSQCKKCHIATSVKTRNPETKRRLGREHESRRRGWKAGSQLEHVSFEVIKLRDKMICGLCDKKVKPEDLSFDHIIPLSCGGAHAEWNLQVAHLSCNCHKRTGTIPSQTRLQFKRIARPCANGEM